VCAVCALDHPVSDSDAFHSETPIIAHGVANGCVALGIGGVTGASMHLIYINSYSTMYIYIYIYL